MRQLPNEANGHLKVSNSHARHLRWFTLLIVLSVFAGCTTMKQGFQPTEKANISLFADNTIALLSDSDFGLQKNTLVITRDYFDPTAPAAVALLEKADEIDRFVANVLSYSINIVTLSETDRTNAEKVALYADQLDTLRSKAMQKTDMTVEEFSEMMESIRKQSNLLGAFRQAQPLINAAVRYAASVLFELDRMGFEIASDMEVRIDADFAYAVDFIDEMKDEKLVILNGLQLLYRYQAGERSTIKGLRQNPWIRSKKAFSSGTLDGQQIQALEEQLLDRLSTLKAVHWQLSDEVEFYHEAHREVDAAYQELLEDNARVRLALVIWSRAHQKMASGTYDPAKWFDISETPGLLLRIGTKAVL